MGGSIARAAASAVGMTRKARRVRESRALVDTARAEGEREAGAARTTAAQLACLARSTQRMRGVGRSENGAGADERARCSEPTPRHVRSVERRCARLERWPCSSRHVPFALIPVQGSCSDSIQGYRRVCGLGSTPRAEMWQDEAADGEGELCGSRACTAVYRTA